MMKRDITDLPTKWFTMCLSTTLTTNYHQTWQFLLVQFNNMTPHQLANNDKGKYTTGSFFFPQVIDKLVDQRARNEMLTLMMEVEMEGVQQTRHVLASVTAYLQKLASASKQQLVGGSYPICLCMLEPNH